MTRAILLALLTLAAAPAAASAHGWPRMPLPPHYTVAAAAGHCAPGAAGCADQDQGIAYIGDARATATAAYMGRSGTRRRLQRAVERFLKLHELGHLFDTQVLTDRDRGQLQLQFHITGAWDTGTGTAGMRSPNEWAADFYARCRMHMDTHSRVQVAAYSLPASPRRTARICAVFAAAAHRAGLR